MKRILLVIIIAMFFVLYLFQHRYSVLSTQQLAKLEKQKQLLNQEIIALEGEKTKTFLFTNLEDDAQQLNLFFPKTAQTHYLSTTKKYDLLTNLVNHE